MSAAEKIVEMPSLTRAMLPVKSVDTEARTVDVVFTTGHKDKRYGWFGDEWFEELEVTDAAVRMDRLNNGAPVLDTHGRWSLRDIIGVVERAWIEDGVGYATLRISDREEIEPIWRDIQNGIIRNISVGYRVHKWQEERAEDDKLSTFRAIDWEPIEVSFVPVGFDPAAQSRSKENESQELHRSAVIYRSRPEGESNNNGERDMSQKVDQGAPETPAKTPDFSAREAELKAQHERELKEARDQAKKDEATRQADIREMVRKARLDGEMAEKLIADEVSVDQARAAVIDALAERDENADTRSGVEVVTDARDLIRVGVTNAIMHRADPGKVDLKPEGRDYAHRSLIEVARLSLERAGVSTSGMAPDEIAARALHTTSDFAEIVADVANKSARMAYEAAPQTWRRFSRETTARDFKTLHRVQLSGTPALNEVNEHGEFEHGTMSDSEETYAVKTYGRIVGITRKTLINDDLDAFTRLPQLFGRSAANKESDIVWALITANGNMGDSTALFHADHGNLTASGGAIDVAALNVAFSKMALQKDPDNQTYLNVMGKYLLVPTAIFATARQYVSDIVPADSAKVNPFAGLLEVIAEPRLDANDVNAWYLAADPSDIDVIEHAYLEGNRGVYTETRNGFEVDGVEVKCRIDFGAAVMDYRGLYKNDGGA